tara:strand:- start:45 stop:299 length:255 start_codon:yes stop_codon:yes gene_type:complete
MIGKAGNITEATLSRAQIRLELESARKTVDRLARTIQLVGDAGVADPETSNELDAHLGAAYAAAYRWLLESRLQATGTGIAIAR